MLGEMVLFFLYLCELKYALVDSHEYLVEYRFNAS